MLDPDYEDELVFSLCCLDEFRDLIQEIGEPLLKAGDPGTMPLDFLPVVTEMPADKPSTETVEEVQSDSRENPDECLISLSDQEEHPEERITREIEALITQDEQDDTPQPAEDDCFDLNFLPLLVDEDIQEKVLEKPIDKAEILPLEVIGEELRQRIPEAYADADRIPENWSWQVLPKETHEAVKSIDWAGIAVKNKEFELEAEAENREQGKSKIASTKELSPYGYSVFEELFRTADTESKLILLDELLTIGDEKEWFFLTTLVDDPSIHVRKKAAKVQAELESRLSFTLPETERPNDNVDQSIETAVDQENTGPLFELGFELDPEYGAESHTEEGQDSSIKEDDVATGKFLSHFKAFSHKILDKFYG
ncbi:MAG: hypothetical protein KJO94_07525 [Eudoraea sp.]|nr:hypothetical protein [Eudoraea sp.]